MIKNTKQTIGIIGGGQLGQMMAIAAQYMGHKVITLDPNPNCSAAKVSDELIVAPYDDVENLLRLAYACDVITYEFENVSAKALHEIEDCVRIPQGIRLLEITQNRRFEKEFLTNEAEKLPETVTRKQVLKTTTGGYDGHGQVVLNADKDLSAAKSLTELSECVLEDFISFEREISVIISGNGHEYVVFPLAENEHRENILHQTISPARISAEITENAYKIATSIAEKLELSGVRCVEMFLTADGQIYVNELAPRPHNSGHFTIESCDFNQFDLHIKGILGEDLPEPKLLKPAIMLNVLGQHVEAVKNLNHEHADWHQHDYGKADAKHNRKMGHVTILTNDFDQTINEIKATKIWD